MCKLWHDRTIRSGSKWKKEINDAIEKSDFAVLLIPSSYLQSEFIRENESPRLTRRIVDVLARRIGEGQLMIRYPSLIAGVTRIEL